MVRKINKKEKKKKQIIKFVPSTEQIDQYIDEFIDYLKTICDDKELIEKFACFTKDNSNIEFMQKAMILTRIFKRVDIEKDERFNNDMILKIKEMIVEYEKRYIPKMSTLVYLNIFAINKILSRYFKFNLYRKRFSKNNTNDLYKSESYKKISDMLCTRPIQADKNRCFTGIWNDKALDLSKKMDKLLHRLDKYRETYIVSKSIMDEFERIKKSLDYEFSEQHRLTKKEINYIRKVFGPMADEIIKQKNEDPCIVYKAEYNLILDLLLYMITALGKNNMDFLYNDIATVSGNRFLAEDVVNNTKDVINKINCFTKNFENLVCEGIDTFDDNARFKEIFTVKED